MKVLVPLYLVVFAIALRQFVADSLWFLRRARQPGLNTVADADAFVLVLREEPAPLLHHQPVEWEISRARTTPLVAELVAQDAPRVIELTMVRTETRPVLESTPIYDELCRDIDARRRALRWPTVEMRAVFDALVERWMCTRCEYEACRGCPGCSCECKLVAA